jgi:hypothetical protein
MGGTATGFLDRPNLASNRKPFFTNANAASIREEMGGCEGVPGTQKINGSDCRSFLGFEGETLPSLKLKFEGKINSIPKVSFDIEIPLLGCIG